MEKGRAKRSAAVLSRASEGGLESSTLEQRSVAMASRETGGGVETRGRPAVASSRDGERTGEEVSRGAVKASEGGLESSTLEQRSGPAAVASRETGDGVKTRGRPAVASSRDGERTSEERTQ
ncbi:hypothetical protein ACJRO7_013567 [Eucalyptus globulus]|uniref:Uncharacterized protein n=1 Tax=Eucalyptus globulus TaxID=34317 RepID=A0ABD3KYB4_EUCGL